MRNKDIEKSIKRVVSEAPTLDFEKLASTPVVKMGQHDYITRQEVKQKPKYFKQYSAAFTFGLILLMCISGWYYQYMLPDSVIALDVNPSIELVTNKQNTVLSVKAINQDAQKVIQGHDYVNMDLNSAVDSICKSMITLGYLNNNKNEVMVSVANGDTDKAETQTKLLGAVIRKDAASKNITPRILRQVLDKDKVKENSDLAEKYNVSIGKINLITAIATSSENLSVEKLSDMSIKDLITTCKDNSIDLNQIIKTDDKDLYVPDSSGSSTPNETKPDENSNSNELIPDSGNSATNTTDTNIVDVTLPVSEAASSEVTCDAISHDNPLTTATETNTDVYYVTYSGKVNSSAINPTNYSADGDNVFGKALFANTDKEVVKLILKDDAIKTTSTKEVDVKNIKDAEGNSVSDKTFSNVSFTDNYAPRVIRVDVVDTTFVKVTFNEKIATGGTTAVEYYVAQGSDKLDISGVSVDNTGKVSVVTITLDEAIDDPDATITAGTSDDFNGKDFDGNSGLDNSTKTDTLNK